MVTALAFGLFFLPCVEGAAGPHSEIRPEITVKASSGPIELSLNILRSHLSLREETRVDYDWERLASDFPTDPPPASVMAKYAIKSRVRVAEPIWFKLAIKNVGRRPVTVFPDIFWEYADFRKALEEGQDSRIGVFFVITGPDGRPVKRRESPMPYPCSGLDDKKNPFLGPPEDPAEDAETDRLISNWRKEGHSSERIDRLLNEQRRGAFARAHPRKVLRPGEKVSTRAWVFNGLCHEETAASMGDFAELWSFELTSPGRYEIRAVYDQRASSAGLVPEAVYLRTPAVVIEVRGP